MIFDIRNPLYPLKLMSGRAQTRRAWRLPVSGLGRATLQEGAQFSTGFRAVTAFSGSLRNGQAARGIRSIRSNRFSKRGEVQLVKTSRREANIGAGHRLVLALEVRSIPEDERSPRQQEALHEPAPQGQTHICASEKTKRRSFALPFWLCRVA